MINDNSIQVLPHNIGFFFGYGIALSIFTSLLYYFFFSKLLSNIDYRIYISGVLGAYFVIFMLIKLFKRD
jgi:hypothetical protein